MTPYGPSARARRIISAWKNRQVNVLKDPDPHKESRMSTDAERSFRQGLEEYIARSPGTNVVKLSNFAKYVPRQSLTRFLSHYELFQKVLRVQGSVVECGVLHGGGLMSSPN